MADKEEEAAGGGGDNTTRGTDWEVVSLTASAYAASPGPKPVDDVVTTTNTTPSEAEAPETSHPLYMSRHFVFPSTEEEEHQTIIPMEPPSEIYQAGKKMDSDDFSMEHGKEVGGDLSLDLAKDDEFLGLDFLDKENGQRDENNNNIYKNERAFGGSHVYEHPDITPPVELEDDDDDDDDDDKDHQVPPPPCDPWWKRSAASFISQAKETNTVWSIFIAAAAVMGVVVLGQRWQHDRWQLLQLNWESTIANEKAGRLMGPISRLKQAFVGGQRRDSFIRASSQNDS